MNEIIVEMPSPLTDKEKKMIYGYHGELIRCKDCRYYEENFPFGSRISICLKWRIEGMTSWTDEYGYCYKAERKEE